jgi:hypothetical protein
LKNPRMTWCVKESIYRLSKKYQNFLEATIRGTGKWIYKPGIAPFGIHSSNLTRISKGTEEATITTFKNKKSKNRTIVYAHYQQLKAEKESLEHTIIKPAAELAQAA